MCRKKPARFAPRASISPCPPGLPQASRLPKSPSLPRALGLPRARWLPPALWMPPALWVALALLAAGCADKTLALRRGLAEPTRIAVVYVDGTLITRVEDTDLAAVPTPAMFRSLGRTVRETLAKHLTHRQVLEADPSAPPGEAGLKAVVSVHGGYLCRGGEPVYHCTLTLQVQLTFLAGRTGRVVGHAGNVVGEAWYGRHPVRSPRGGEPSDWLRVRIEREIPLQVLLGPLQSATEEGLADFLERMQSPPKAPAG